MFFQVLWILVGIYFIYLGAEILFFKVTKRIGSLETYQYKNKQAFIFRVGLIELLAGIFVTAGAIYSLMNYSKVLVTYTFIGIERELGYGIIPIGIALIAVIALWMNQIFSQVKSKKNKDNEKKLGE